MKNLKKLTYGFLGTFFATASIFFAYDSTSKVTQSSIIKQQLQKSGDINLQEEQVINIDPSSSKFIQTDNEIIIYDSSASMWYSLNLFTYRLAPIATLNQEYNFTDSTRTFTYDDFMWVNTLEGTSYLQFSNKSIEYGVSKMYGTNAFDNSYAYFDLNPNSETYHQFIESPNQTIWFNNIVSPNYNLELWNYYGDSNHGWDLNSEGIYAGISLLKNNTIEDYHDGNHDNLNIFGSNNDFSHEEANFENGMYNPISNESVYYSTVDYAAFFQNVINNGYIVWFTVEYIGSQGAVFKMQDPKGITDFNNYNDGSTVGTYDFYVNFETSINDIESGSHSQQISRFIPIWEQDNSFVNIDYKNTRYISDEFILASFTDGTTPKLINFDENVTSSSSVNADEYNYDLTVNDFPWDYVESNNYFVWEDESNINFLDKNTNEIFSYTIPNINIDEVAPGSNNDFYVSTAPMGEYIVNVKNTGEGTLEFSAIPSGTNTNNVIYYSNGMLFLDNGGKITVEPIYLLETNISPTFADVPQSDLNSTTSNYIPFFNDYPVIDVNELVSSSDDLLRLKSVKLNGLSIKSNNYYEPLENQEYSINTSYYLDKTQSKLYNELELTFNYADSFFKDTEYVITYNFGVLKNYLPSILVSPTSSSTNFSTSVYQKQSEGTLVDAFNVVLDDTNSDYYDIQFAEEELVKTAELNSITGDSITIDNNSGTIDLQNIVSMRVEDIVGNSTIIEFPNQSNSSNYSEYWSTPSGQSDLDKAQTIGINESTMKSMNAAKIAEMNSYWGNAISTDLITLNTNQLLNAAIMWNDNHYINPNEISLTSIKNEETLIEVFESSISEQVSNVYNNETGNEVSLINGQDYFLQWNLGLYDGINFENKLSVTFISTNYEYFYGSKEFEIVSNDNLSYIDLGELKNEKIERFDTSKKISSYSDELEQAINDVLKTYEDTNEIVNSSFEDEMRDSIVSHTTNWVNENYAPELAQIMNNHFNFAYDIVYSNVESYYNNNVTFEYEGKKHIDLTSDEINIQDIYFIDVNIEANTDQTYFVGNLKDTVVNDFNAPLLPIWAISLLSIIGLIILIIIVLIALRITNKIKYRKKYNLEEEK